jgi:hypothetical protein
MLAVLAVLFVASHAGSAAADSSQNYWSSVASGCVPGDPAIQNDRYTVTAGSVGHNGTNIDTITLYCPVQQNTSATSPSWLWLTYRDSSGTTTTSDIHAQLIRMDRSTGSVTNISGALVDSDDQSDTGITHRAVNFTHTFDFGAYYYYVRVDLVRSGTGVTVTFYGVALDSAQL